MLAERNRLIRRVTRHRELAVLFRPKPAAWTPSTAAFGAAQAKPRTVDLPASPAVDGDTNLTARAEPLLPTAHTSTPSAPPATIPAVPLVRHPRSMSTDVADRSADQTAGSAAGVPISSTVNAPEDNLTDIAAGSVADTTTDSTITDSVWHRLTTIFRRHQERATDAPADIAAPADATKPMSQPALASAPSASLPSRMARPEGRHRQSGAPPESPGLSAASTPAPATATPRGALTSAPDASPGVSSAADMAPTAPLGAPLTQEESAVPPSSATRSVGPVQRAADASRPPAVADPTRVPTGPDQPPPTTTAASSATAASSGPSKPILPAHPFDGAGAPSKQTAATEAGAEARGMPESTGDQGPRIVQFHRESTPPDWPPLPADDASDATVSAPPLQEVWQVERRGGLRVRAESDGDAPPPTVRRPRDNTASVSAEPSMVAQVLDGVEAGRPTRSSIENLPPRRPRPAHPPVQRSPVAPSPTEGMPGPPSAALIAAEVAPPTSVETAIGPLPADLWELIGEPLPPASEAVPGQSAPAPKGETVSTRPSVPTRRPSERPESSILQRSPARDAYIRPPRHRSAAVSDTASDGAPDAPPDGASENPPDEATEANTDLDLEELARRVYVEIRRRLVVEVERARTR